LFSLAFNGMAEQRYLMFSDPFNGTDGSIPDPTAWEYYGGGAQCNTYINLNMLHIEEGGHRGIQLIDPFRTGNFTVILDWKVNTENARMMGLRINSTKATGEETCVIILNFDRDSGWFLEWKWRGQWFTYISYKDNVNLDMWYTINVTVKSNTLKVVVKERTSGSVKFTQTRTTDPALWNNSVQINSGAETWFDNFKIFDLTWHPPPRWSSTPTFSAVEDVAIGYNLSAYVSDVDTPNSEIALSSISTCVLSIDGMEVTFVFPNGLDTRSVLIVASDGRTSSPALLNFTVEPVNDPPEAAFPAYTWATEEVPLTIDLSAYIYDVDNDTKDLIVTIDDPYTSIAGLNITAVFPEGLMQHDLHLLIHDGLNWTRVVMHFKVHPVDDPPSIAALPPLTIIEDSLAAFNITPYLSDIDTPTEDLVVNVLEPACQVHGQQLTFLYNLGGLDRQVTIYVFDGTSTVHAILLIHVTEADDPPTIAPIPTVHFEEDMEETFDLSPYVSDEDTRLEELELLCDGPGVQTLIGLRVSMLYSTWVENHVVNFTISDGSSYVNGSFSVQVLGVNDGPVIISLGGMMAPVVLPIPENGEAWFPIEVYDEDSSSFTYGHGSDWPGATMLDNGSLHVKTTALDVGFHSVIVTVKDGSGGLATLEVWVDVFNVNDPPRVPKIDSPSNRSTVVEGENVTFSVTCDDPDLAFGQTLSVTWSSDISGELHSTTSGDGLEFVSNQLPVGLHRISVTVSDGEFQRTTWFVLTVEPMNTSPDDGDKGWLGPFSLLLVSLALMAIILVIGTIRSSSRRRTQGTVGSEETGPLDEDSTDDADLDTEVGQTADDDEQQDEYDRLYGEDLGERD
jgi:hypothetical protein